VLYNDVDRVKIICLSCEAIPESINERRSLKLGEGLEGGSMLVMYK
jgi:hypothetical protein